MKWDECDCEAVLSVRSLEREVLMSAIKETESSGSDEEEVHNPEVGELYDLEEGTSSHVSTSSELLNSHCVKWAEQSEMNIDYDQGSHPNHELIWTAGTPQLEQRTPFHYFCLMFPMDDANEWITKTSSALTNLHRRALTISEYFCFWGLIQAISLGTKPNRRNYWIVESDTISKQVYPPHSFGSHFCMGIQRFEDILHCLSFVTPILMIVGHLYAHFSQPSTTENKGLSFHLIFL